jgi:pyruvate dehydrogenase E2 component (dihydrolipoamide acetyltransferase)
MAAELKVPKLGMDMEEAEIVRWIVEEGSEVEKGDPVLEIDTDKVAYEIEANAGGTIRDLQGSPGETIQVGATLAYIVAPGEDWTEPTAAGDTNSGNGTAPVESGASPQPAAEEKPEALKLGNGRRLRASPAARRAAAARELTLEAIAGSGPDGRVYLSDVLEADVRQRPVEDAPIEATPEATETPAPTTTTGPPVDSSSSGVVREKLSRIRRVGAERTAKSFAEVPHFYLNRDLEVDRLLDLRERLKAKMDPAPSITELLALAVTRTLKDHPRLNARYVEGGEIELNPRVNLGIAASTDEGLVVPVLHGADTLALRDLIPAVKDLVQRARDEELGADELSGGTFTISNLGMMGVDNFDAIINAPQAGILALGRVRTVPEWRGGEWLPLRVISATLSVDHRVADGADGARFLEGLQAALSDWEILL